MDDIAGKLNELLSDPQTMSQIQNLVGSLGQSGQNGNSASGQSNQVSPPQQDTNGGLSSGLGNLNLGDLTAALGALTGQNSQNTPNAQSGQQPNQPSGQPSSQPAQGLIPALPGNSLQTILRLAPLFQSIQQEDSSTRLLGALRPMLGAARQKKLDEAIRMLQMLRLIPLLKKGGLF